MITNDKYIKTALHAAKEAGKIFKQNFGCPKSVKTKGGNERDFVTEVDLNIEKLIRKIVLKEFPDHKFIGEEMGRDNINKDDLIWIIDPIDGTTNFIHGIPFCCVSVALWDSQGPLAGVIFNPISNELYTAQRGKGAYLNGKKIKVSGSKKLADSFGGIGWGRDIILAAKIFPQLIKQANKARTFGSAALEICQVACGAFDYYIHGRLSIWDAAAGILIVTEAGGKVTDWKGNCPSPALNNLIASNGSLQKELLDKIKKLKT